MGSRKKRVAFIPVRGGSKSIPQKNIKEIGGKPLVYWVIDAALESGVFDDIYISADDKEIVNTVQKHPQISDLTIISRSAETATDNASTESAMVEFANNHEFDYITLIQATSPLLMADDLRNGMEIFLKAPKASSLLSVCRQERFIWKKDKNGYSQPVNYRPSKRPRRQEFDGFLVENGAFYITDKGSLLKANNRLSGQIISYEMSPESYFELDEPSDWSIIEALLHNKKETSFGSKFKNIKLFLTDVDGVLTDAGMYYSENGDELKKFNTRDGKGIELLRKSGIKTGIITSEDTQIVSNRAKKLKVDFLYQGRKSGGKLEAAKEICNKLNIDLDQVAYIGDDINDLALIRKVGFSACPADAVLEVKPTVDYICSKSGGKGCVRELTSVLKNKFG